MAKKLIGKRRLKEIALKLAETRYNNLPYQEAVQELKAASEKLGIDSSEMLAFFATVRPTWDGEPQQESSPRLA